MATLLDFTTYADIRSLLGVDATELEDDTLGLETYINSLKLEFDEVDQAILPLYVTVGALTPRSDDQQRFYEGCRLFAAYAVCNRLASSLPLFAPKDITDGKAAAGRFADSPYREVIKEARAQYDRLRLKLPAMLAKVSASTTVTTPRTYFATVAPSIDPVTG